MGCKGTALGPLVNRLCLPEYLVGTDVPRAKPGVGTVNRKQAEGERSETMPRFEPLLEDAEGLREL